MSITVETLKSKVIIFLNKNNISNKSKILVAYSGGPDSSALLWLLNDIKDDIGFAISALYVNHGIRSELEMSNEIQQIKKITNSLNIKIEFENIEHGFIKSESIRTGRSIEDLARKYRYSFLDKFKKNSNATHIAMGHTLDDQRETLIMRFFQGSGIYGLAGIPEKRDIIIRPLLKVDKNELKDYLKLKSIPYVIDKTNLDTVYLRNKIRLKLIPVIEDIFPGYKKSIGIFSEKMDMIRSALSENDKIPDIYVTENGDSWFFKSDYINLPEYLQVEIIYKSWDIWENKPFNRLPYKFLSNAIGYTSGKASNIILDGYNCRLIRDKERLIWKRVVVVSDKKSYLRVITVGEYELFPGFYLKIEEKSEFEKDVIWFNREKLSSPLLVRSRISGDRINLAEGIKPIKKLFNDWGIMPDERWKIPVIEDRKGILAVIGKPFGYSNRIAFNYKNCRENTVNLVISANYMENISE